MPKKGLAYNCPKKVVRTPADVIALEGYGNMIANAIRTYYATRNVSLIGKSTRAKRVKGKAPKKAKG